MNKPHAATVALVQSSPAIHALIQTNDAALEALMRFDRIARNLPELVALSTDPKVATLVDARLRAEAATIRRLLDQAA